MARDREDSRRRGDVHLGMRGVNESTPLFVSKVLLSNKLSTQLLPAIDYNSSMDYDKILANRISKGSRFDSEKEELAWDIARYFDEPYREWLVRIERTGLLTGQIRSGFASVKDGYYGKKKAVKILMAKICG